MTDEQNTQIDSVDQGEIQSILVPGPGMQDPPRLANISIKRVLSDHEYGNREIRADVIVRAGEDFTLAVQDACAHVDGLLGEWQYADRVHEARKTLEELQQQIWDARQERRRLELGDSAGAQAGEDEEYDPFLDEEGQD